MKKIKLLLSIFALSILLTACVDQSGGKKELQYGEKIENPRVIATSVATLDILYRLDANMIGIPSSELDNPPEEYKDLPKVGIAMTPDIEIIKSLQPDYVFGPVSLISDLLPKYEAAGINYGFLNLNNVPGMFKSIEDLGKLLGKEKEAQVLIDDYEEFMKNYKSGLGDKEPKRVLILMGLPGSYVVATENSYVGSLVELAGAENVYAGTNQQFININTEDMLSKNPDMILRTAHALPDEVMDMFKDEFSSNDIWKHFDCVKNDEVYDLDYNKFGMSAKFNYKEALEDLRTILYE